MNVYILKCYIHNIPIICFFFLFFPFPYSFFSLLSFSLRMMENNHYKQFMINYDTRNKDSNENVNWHSISFPLIAQSFTFNTIFWHLFDRQSHVSFYQSRIGIRVSTKKYKHQNKNVSYLSVIFTRYNIYSILIYIVCMLAFYFFNKKAGLFLLNFLLTSIQKNSCYYFKEHNEYWKTVIVLFVYVLLQVFVVCDFKIMHS